MKLTNVIRESVVRTVLIMCFFIVSCSPGVPKENLSPTPTHSILHDAEATATLTPEPPLPSTRTTTATAVPLLQILTNTPRSLPVLLPTATQPQATQMNDQAAPFNDRYLVLNEYNQQLILVDSRTGRYRVLKSDTIYPHKIISFSNDGCELITTMRDGDVTRVDLKGQVVKELLPVDWYGGDGHAFPQSLSPFGDWMVFMIGSGVQGYASWEKQDFETINLTTKARYSLTDHHGAWDASWSSDGSWIVFSDYDVNKINQIFVSLKDGAKKTKLTEFGETDLTIRMLRWSPDDKKIAYTRFSPQDGSISLGVIVLGDPAEKLDPKLPGIVRNFWWQDSEVLVAHTAAIGNPTTGGQDALIWLNTSTGEITDRLSASDTPDRNMISSLYYDRSTVGFFSDKSFFTYDIEERTIKWHFDSFFNYSSLLLAPEQFPGEQECSSSK